MLVYWSSTMNTLTIIYAVIFLIVSTISFSFGALSYTSREMKTSKIPFLLMCVCLGIWALGFALAISAPTRDACLTWRRFSALGWGTMYTASLHMAFCLNEIHKKKFFKYILPLLYAPAAVVIYIFALSNDMAAIQYKLVQYESGWTNRAVNNGWDLFFYIYMAVYVVLTFVLIWRHWKTTSDSNKKTQARILLTALEAAVALGTFSDLINNSFKLLPIPQLAPIFMLIPLAAFYYNIRKLKYLGIDISSEEKILTDSVRRRLLMTFSVALLASSVLYYITQVFYENSNIMTTVIISGIFLVFSGLIFATRRFILKKQLVELLFTFSFIILIPTITMLSIKSASISVWAFPFLCILFALLFDTKRLLITTSISIVQTQLLAWVLFPSGTVSVKGSDYAIRLVIFMFGIFFARYINAIYVRRLRENSENNKYRQLISETSVILGTDMLNNGSGLDMKIKKLLAECAVCFGTDVAFVQLYDPKSSTMTGQYFWKAGDSQDLFPHGRGYDSLCQLLMAKEVVLNDTCGHTILNTAMKPHLNDISARAILSTPLPLTENNAGFLGLMSEIPVRWRASQVESLRIISKTISDSLTKLAAEKEIEFMAYHDYLTRLPNRMLFIDRTEQAIRLARRTGKQIGVLFLDLDAFKGINDTMGHRVGDELIKEIAQKLSGCVRASDTVSRFGGDEFLIMLNNMSKPSDFQRVADEVMALFNGPFYLHGQEIFITASAGIAVYPFDGEDTETLIKNADIAMYNAKENGKNRYLFCSADMREDVQQKVRLTNALYRALEKNELRVYYQPQVNVQTQRIVGAEALLRWFHPELGMISPGIFIPLAEQTGLISAIGHWVLKESCRQIKEWQMKGLPEIRVAVNISVNQIRHATFVNQVSDILQENGLDAKYLELELTESTVIKEPDYIIETLEKLKKLGIYLSIDDFGTEYSSLSRLKKLPVDRIKMDMQFVQGIDTNEKDRAISKGIINLAKSLNINVLAEGVETQEQLDFLTERQCDEVQGYIFYKPMPGDEFEKILVGMNL